MKGRRVLSFFLGMIFGIIIFVLAIGGAVFGIIATFTVGGVQDKITDQDFINQNAVIHDLTILEAIKQVIEDVKQYNNLSLELLYDHYGIAIFKELAGIDLTQKEFYSTPIASIVQNPDILINSISLKDIGDLTGLDFTSYGLPILTDNLNVGVITAVDNILNSFNGGLSIRTIKDKFGIDLGVNDNAILASLQDVDLQDFGAVINALYLNTLLDADVDFYIAKGENTVYVQTDTYQLVSNSDLFASVVGAETYLCGANGDKQDVKELRYVKKVVDGVETFVVDNSCYADDFAPAGDSEFYRHILYTPYTTDMGSVDTYYVQRFVDRVDTFSATDFTLLSQGFQSLKEIYTHNGLTYASYNSTVDSASIVIDDIYTIDNGNYVLGDNYTITTPNAKSKLNIAADDATTRLFGRAHTGSATPILKLFAYLTVAELQNADDMLGDIKIGDIIEIDENSPKLLTAIQNYTLTTIGNALDDLTIDQLIDVDDNDALMSALAKRNVKISELASVVHSLSIGEILTLDYDVYEPYSGQTGVTVYSALDVVVPYNEYFHKDRPDVVVDEVNNTATIKVYYIYEGTPTSDNYVCTHVGTSSIVLQSLALRGTTLDGMSGDVIDNLYINELMRITADSNRLMKAISKRCVKFSEFGSIIDDLRLDEVIDIDSSSKIMQSLAKHDCTIAQLGTIADELTFAEMIDIISNEYVPNANGAYVLVEEAGFVLFDEAESNMQYLARFDKVDNAYVNAVDGKYVHAYHFTPYNPAMHSSMDRYDIVDNPNASSKLLQRFAFSTMSASAFDNLILADVMEMSLDEYTLVGAEYLATHPDDQYFVFDENVFMHAQKPYDGQTLYTITNEGSTNKFLKRIAFASVNSLASAMGKIMDDIVLGDVIDIVLFNQVEITDTNPIDHKPTSIQENSDNRYFVPAISGTDYTFVYNSTGKYMMRSYQFVSVDEDDLALSGVAYYKYVPVTYSNIATATASENLYYYTTSGTYAYNTALCMYCVSTGDYSKLYTRVAASSSDPNAVAANVYGNANLYVDLNGSYRQYDSSNLVHLDNETYYQLEEEAGAKYFVNISSYGKFGDSSYVYTDGADILYSKIYCDYVYILDENGNYVFVNGKYVVYDSTMHNGLDRYTQNYGCVVSGNSVFYEVGAGSGNFETDLSGFVQVNVLQEQSTAILRLFAKNEVKVSSLDSVIADATLRDIIDIDPDGIFAKIADAKINQIDTALEETLSTLTIGELLELAAISDVDEQVKNILKDVKISNFFNSLKYSQERGIYLDLAVALGYDE